MARYLVIVLLTAMTALGTQATPSPSATADQGSLVTFNKDVLPILQNNCQVCHRPGGVAPMSLLTYESTRPWAKAIRTAVVTRKMPPWFADSHYGDFRNAPKLTAENINTLVAWADNGAREGDAADKPSQLPEWKDGWRIQPDVVVSMPEAYHLGASGKGEIKEFFIPSPFKEDTWVTSIEIRPGDPSVVHHAIVQVGDQNQVSLPVSIKSKIAGTPPFVPGNIRIGGNTPNGGGYSNVVARDRERQTGHGAFMTMDAVYAPGSQPMNFRYTDSAKLIPGGKPIRLEVHYTPNGKETTDRTMVGFILAKGPAKRRFIIMAPEHLVDSRTSIPAGEANYETTGELVFNQDVNLVWFMPHMHLRGKDMTYRLIYPNRREETVLSARFNFHWQLGYELENPIRVPKGTRMVVTAHHDNSANNPLNPSPGKTVGWGQLTAEEMMIPWFGVVVARDAQPDAIATYKPGDLDDPLPARRR